MTQRNPWESGNTALQEIAHWSQAVWLTRPPAADRLEEIAQANAEHWESVVQRIEQLKGSIPERLYTDLLTNAIGQCHLLEILPRIVLLRVWIESNDKASTQTYNTALDRLRELALSWQSAAPKHFEDMMGYFVFKAVHEARLWLTARRPEGLPEKSPVSAEVVSK